MFNSGDLWLNYDGKLLSVNYQSDFEKDKRIILIEKEKTSIHETLKEFEEPILTIKTKKFKIRIDKMNNGKFRYASWSIDTQMSEKPDLIIKNGQCIL